MQKNKCKVCVSIATAVVWDAQCSTSVTLRRNAPEGMCTQGIPCPHLTANLCHRVMMYYIDFKVSVRSDSHLIAVLLFFLRKLETESAFDQNIPSQHFSGLCLKSRLVLEGPSLRVNSMCECVCVCSGRCCLHSVITFKVFPLYLH